MHRVTLRVGIDSSQAFQFDRNVVVTGIAMHMSGENSGAGYIESWLQMGYRTGTIQPPEIPESLTLASLLAGSGSSAGMNGGNMWFFDVFPIYAGEYVTLAALNRSATVTDHTTKCTIYYEEAD